MPPKQSVPKSVPKTDTVKKIIPTKPVVITKPKITKIVNNYFAVEQKIPDNIQLSFDEAIGFYKTAFMKELCISRAFLDQESTKKHIINPRTGSPYDSYTRIYDFKFTKDNSIKFGTRTISMTKFFTDETFRNSIVSYYNKLGYNCEIYQLAYDKIKKRYTKVCVKIMF
jgi:hypothetical protein